VIKIIAYSITQFVF